MPTFSSNNLIGKFYKWALAPHDPSLLGYLRCVYGFLMLFDLVIERGMPHMDQRWSDDNDNCRFPLFHELTPMSYKYMACLHAVMAISIFFVAIGFLTKYANFIFMCGYWFIFLNGKETWNNHSYLFGLFSFMFLNSNANHYFSVDAWLWPKMYKNKHIPGIQYGVIRLQLFILYFYAGIKKYDDDWLDGYSMGKLSRHWAFEPMKMIGLSSEFIDLFIVHLGGFAIDMFTGFLLYFDKTRKIAFVVMMSFHGLNSQLFSIGMFSYTCICTQFAFCHESSFRKLLRDKSEPVMNFAGCVYESLKQDEKASKVESETQPQKTEKSSKTKKGKKAEKGTEKSEKPKEEEQPIQKVGTSNNISIITFVQSLFQTSSKPTTVSTVNTIKVLLIVCYMSIQLFLPFSHFITLGYNGWTQGTYGYSWDMMIHSFSTQHVKIRYVDPITGEDGYLKPDAFTSGRASSRWTQHPDQLWQYAHCLKDKLIDLEIGSTEQPPELYFDVWKTMNKRFNQRVYRSDINIIDAKWEWNKHPSYTLPLLSGYDDWRPKIKEMSKQMMNQSEYTEVTFIADFPGMFLENFLNKDLGNTTIEVLGGQVKIELVDQQEEAEKWTELGVGDRKALPADEFHNVHVIGDGPACYMYIYENTTHKEFIIDMKAFETKIQGECDIEKKDEYTDEEKEANGKKIYEYLKTYTTTSEEKKFFDVFMMDLHNRYGEVEIPAIDPTQKPTKLKRAPLNEAPQTDRMLRAVEKKLWLGWRSYKLSKFALGDVVFGWKPQFREYMSLEEPNFVFGEWVYRSQDYVNGRIARKERYELSYEQKFLEFHKEENVDEDNVEINTDAETEA